MNHPSPIELARDDPWQAEQIAREAVPASRVNVPERLTRPSALLVPTIAAVNSGRRTALARDKAHRVDGKPLDYANGFDGLLFKHLPMGFRVTVGTADRAILIVDTLIKVCEARGLRAFAGKDGLRIGFGDYSARVRISERVEQLHGAGKKPSTMDRSTPFIAHRPTSKLTLFVERLSALRNVVDKPGMPLEAQMNAAIVLVCRAIAETKAWREYFERITREAQEDRQAQADKAAMVVAAKKEIEQRRQDLMKEAAAWQQSAVIRQYANQVAAISQAPSPSLQEWLVWAHYIADELDPIPARVGADVPGKREYRAEQSQDKG